MALNKKNKRKITVNEDVFYWTFKKLLQEHILRLIVMTEDKTNSRLVYNFKYKDFWFYFKELAEGRLKTDELYDDEFLKATGGILTPQVVRQIVDFALQKGWKPFEKGKDFFISDVKDKMDINFGTETTADERKSKIQNLKSEIL